MSVIALKKTYLPADKIPGFAFAGVIIFALVFAVLGISDVLSTKVYASGAERSAVAYAPAEGKSRAINIASNGFILLRDAHVISMDSGNIVAKIAWGSQSFEWRVNVEYNTKFFRRNGEKGKLDEIKEGDLVTITGVLNDSADEPAIVADYVRY